MTDPLFRADEWDAEDRETRHGPEGTIRSPEVLRNEAVIKVALRLWLLAKSDEQAISQMRRQIACLGLPLHRLYRLYELAAREAWPPESEWVPSKPGRAPRRGCGCTQIQWQAAAYLVHRAALSLLMNVRPRSYPDVHDQLKMLFCTTPSALQSKQRAALTRRLTWHVTRMVAGLAFRARPPNAKRLAA